MRQIKVLAALAVTMLVTAVFAGTALAQSPTGNGYGGQAGAPLSGVAGQGSGGAPASQGIAGQSAGTLPFTGIDLALLLAGGIALTAVGAGLVRAGARK
jgi:hypothetical protein